MARLHLDQGLGNSIDEEAMLIDRWQNPDRDAPALRWRGAGVTAGEPPESRFNQGSHAGEAFALCGRDDAVVVPFKQRFTKRSFQLVKLFAKCRLTDVGATGRSGYA